MKWPHSQGNKKVNKVILAGKEESVGNVNSEHPCMHTSLETNATMNAGPLTACTLHCFIFIHSSIYSIINKLKNPVGSNWPGVPHTAEQG